MAKYHFIIIGSGWRALYYVRVAKALPDVFCLDAADYKELMDELIKKEEGE